MEEITKFQKLKQCMMKLELAGGKWNHEFGFAMDENKNEKGQNHSHLKKEKN
jgi:hypothetical protein